MTEEEAKLLRQAHAELKDAYARLKEESEQKDRRIEELEGLLMRAVLRIDELERRLAKDSHNSSKPPSSDGLGRKPGKQRTKRRKRSGGQKGHQGHTLMQVLTPDTVITHRPTHCGHCQCDLREETGRVKECRQLHDLPELRLLVQEHQIEEVCCPACQHLTPGSFPLGVDAPAQYGPGVQALAIYLSHFQLLPLERVCEALANLCQCHLSEGTLVNWITKAAKTLEPTIQHIKTLLLASSLQHADETGIRVKGLLHWMHVNGTRWLTLYSWHRKRGQEALEHIGIWPHFRGRMMHDRWASYDRYPCAHSLCGAHLLRDCLYVAEQEKQPWAQEMFDLLLSMAKAAEQWRGQGAKEIPQEERESWIAQYFSVLVSGFAAHSAQAPPEHGIMPKRPGRKKQDASKNLLDALLKRADQVLGFLEDLTVPFTNNLAERDLRMMKVQQKISGTFRSAEGATAFCVIRSYLSTMRKQGRSLFGAMVAVVAGSPFPVAWGT
ncbi:IS66 family transposase [Ktedonobacter racemifer]|uniref:Transposase n=1 Tax=Ktedonobacter racemifer DSM 44963 TaxID=485913 RepID=D6U250_KTERA|nr:IS66 family transposase [Ktedonobacter racemifer]EFH82718.1 transposase [Ktedonobacter racemifer DSM 44963]